MNYLSETKTTDSNEIHAGEGNAGDHSGQKPTINVHGEPGQSASYDGKG